MKTLLVAAARPNFMKVAPILRALEVEGAETVLVHTGQHYDANMSDAFFRDLEIPHAGPPPGGGLRVARRADGPGDGGFRAGAA
jgi:UDP-N-acetylglucosamine 2-epimerase